MRKAAGAFRSAAANPAPTPLSPLWVDGFCDGLRFCSLVLDVLADGDDVTPDVMATALRAMQRGGRRGLRPSG